MAKRHPGETILVQWTIDERLWRDFIVAKNEMPRDPYDLFVTFTPPQPFPASGIDVVVRDDAIFVGETCVRSYPPGTDYHGISVRGARLEIDRPHDDNNSEIYMLPISNHALVSATRLAEEWTAVEKEAARIQAEEDARPTLANRTRKWVEAHFIFVLLAFFFGVIPLVVLCIYLLSPAFGGDQ